MPKAKKQKAKKKPLKAAKAKAPAKKKRVAAKPRAAEKKKKRAKIIAKLMALRKKKRAGKKTKPPLPAPSRFAVRSGARKKVKAPKKVAKRPSAKIAISRKVKPKPARIGGVTKKRVGKAPKPKRAAARPAAPPIPVPPRPKRRKPPYSKEQIEQLRKELLDERVRLMEELGGLDEIAQNSQGEGRTETPGYSIHPAEYATDTQTLDTALGLRSLAQQNLNEVEEAIERLESGEYGFCEECDKPIEFERLLAKPSARYCINCKKSFEAGRLGS